MLRPGGAPAAAPAAKPARRRTPATGKAGKAPELSQRHAEQRLRDSSTREEVRSPEAACRALAIIGSLCGAPANRTLCSLQADKAEQHLRLLRDVSLGGVSLTAWGAVALYLLVILSFAISAVSDALGLGAILSAAIAKDIAAVVLLYHILCAGYAIQLVSHQQCPAPLRWLSASVIAFVFHVDTCTNHARACLSGGGGRPRSVDDGLVLPIAVLRLAVARTAHCQEGKAEGELQPVRHSEAEGKELLGTETDGGADRKTQEQADRQHADSWKTGRLRECNMVEWLSSLIHCQVAASECFLFLVHPLIHLFRSARCIIDRLGIESTGKH